MYVWMFGNKAEYSKADVLQSLKCNQHICWTSRTHPVYFDDKRWLNFTQKLHGTFLSKLILRNSSAISHWCAFQIHHYHSFTTSDCSVLTHHCDIISKNWRHLFQHGGLSVCKASSPLTVDVWIIHADMIRCVTELLILLWCKQIIIIMGQCLYFKPMLPVKPFHDVINVLYCLCCFFICNMTLLCCHLKIFDCVKNNYCL